ncbi:MAG: glycosyltransferase [Lentisphaerae bacterium]|nr:glycosyltransferase [Lentisphaerota bacterium]
MKLLYVTPNFPYPPHRGYSLMAYHHIEHLSKRHMVDLISFVNAEADGFNKGGLTEWCRQIETVALPTWQSVLTLGLRFFRREPFQVSFLHSSKMAEIINHRLRTQSYDGVIFQLTRMAQYRPDWYKGPTLLSMVDPFVLNYQRSLAWRPWYMRQVLHFEIKRLKTYESRQARLFDRVLLISAADVGDYSPLLPGAKMDWVPHGVDVNNFQVTDTPRQVGRIVLCGSMFFAPNVDAVEYFSMGTPVVTTSAGNQGIGAVSGEHLYVADSPAGFAERVVRLLNKEKWKELSKNGRQFVVENFIWEKSAAKLEFILDQVTSERMVG